MHAPLHAALRVEWRSLDALPPLADECRALADRALEANVFYDPAFMLAAAPVFGADAGAVLVRSAAGRLAGLFPARIERWRGGLSSMLVGWTHPFAPLGTPLIDRVEPEAVVEAWLDFLRDLSMPPLLLLPFVPERGAFAGALDAVLERSGRRNIRLGPHLRALLDPGTERGHYLDHAMSAKRRKELHRQRRRLEEIAPVTLSTAVKPEDIPAALKDFCVLEASGWKGIAGTAIVNDPRVKDFVKGAVMELAAAGRARIDRLMLNGRAIAATIVLESGDTAWCWKIAYNEGLARFSPGVQLMHDLTDSLLSKPTPVRVDSCAIANHPMIDHVWHERLPLSDRLIALRPSAARFLVARGIEATRRSILGEAKAIYHRLRGH
jgi:CelD/BcsL family acetyltransferase involved in cellulose biosynthesis